MGARVRGDDVGVDAGVLGDDLEQDLLLAVSGEGEAVVGVEGLEALEDEPALDVRDFSAGGGDGAAEVGDFVDDAAEVQRLFSAGGGDHSALGAPGVLGEVAAVGGEPGPGVAGGELVLARGARDFRFHGLVGQVRNGCRSHHSRLERTWKPHIWLPRASSWGGLLQGCMRGDRLQGVSPHPVGFRIAYEGMPRWRVIMASSTGRAEFVQPPPSGARPPADEFEEISLVDIVRVLQRRRAVVALVVVLSLVGGGALTLFATPQFEVKAEVIPLEHQLIIRNWLGSRQAAEIVSTSVGPPLNGLLFPEEWDSEAGAWRGLPRSQTDIAAALLEQTSITGGSASGANANPQLTLTVTLPDAVLATRVAQAYIDSLSALRPELESITRSQLFDKYYDGTNAQEAQARAERAAAEKSYWIVFDTPAVPEAPVSPRPVLNMALATVLGLMGGVFAVFGLEWLSKYKTEFAQVRPPSKP